MRSLVIFILLFSVSIPAISQESNGSQQVSQSKFRAEVEKALSFVNHGRELYDRSDLFHRMVDRRVAAHLGLLNKGNISEETLGISGDTTSESDISKTSESENEPSIAISRADPRVIVCGANDYAMFNTGAMSAYVSTNAGLTWKTWHLPKVNDNGCVASGDPIVISDDAGNFYYSFMIGTDNTTTYNEPYFSDIMVGKSSNGTSWTLGNPIVGDDTLGYSYQDKEMIAIDRDPQSPYYGRLYVIWTDYIYDGWFSKSMLSYSGNGGKTWSKPRAYTTNFGYFGTIRVGNGGTVFISSSHFDSTESNCAHAITVSTDGGETFADHKITTYQDYPRTSDWLDALKGDPGFRAFPYITFDLDPSNNALFAVFGSLDGYGIASEYATESKDEGLTWTVPNQIGSPDFLEYDHFFPWVSFDPTTKHAIISLYSSEEDPNNEEARASYTTFDSPDTIQDLGNDLFDPNGVIIAPGSAPFIGDYIGADAYNGYFASAWTESRPNGYDGDIFAYVSSSFSPNGFANSSVHSINAPEFSVSDASPNPAFGNSISFAITTNDESAISIQVFDLRGIVVLRQTAGLYGGISLPVDIHQLSAGVYRAEISNGSLQAEKSFIVLR